MNETNDPLEAELAALRPHEVSPGLQRRIAERLADSPSTRARWLWRIAFAGGLAAACLVMAVVLRRGDTHRVAPEPNVVEVQPAPSPYPLPRGGGEGRVRGHDALTGSMPTLQAYQRALARSPEELDALLDKHASLGSGFHSRSVAIHAFAPFDGQMQTWLGER